MLVVPSVVARREANVLINPQYPYIASVCGGKPERVVWDSRLVTWQ